MLGSSSNIALFQLIFDNTFYFCCFLESGLLPQQVLNSKRKRKLPKQPVKLIKSTFEKHEEKIKKVGALIGCTLIVVIILGKRLGTTHQEESIFCFVSTFI